jgi:hypothetical protein
LCSSEHRAPLSIFYLRIDVLSVWYVIIPFQHVSSTAAMPILNKGRICRVISFCHMACASSAFVSDFHTRGATFRRVSIPRSSTFLCAIAKNSTDFFKSDSQLTVSESRLLLVDTVSIALTAQLLGLVDVLNDPTFLERGGWFQPISPVESTLPVLIQRDSILSMCWILSALGWKGYEVTDVEENGRKTLRIAAGFIALRFAFETAISFGAGRLDFDVWETIQQCYFVILLVGSFRFLYTQYSL